MSGHSKWANIQHRKSNQDIKKSKKFSKILKEISAIAKISGINNFRFKSILSHAKALNIPKKTIEKVIKKSLENNQNDYHNLNLEGKIYGIIMIIECLTDNHNRTVSNIKNCFHKYGGQLCNNGELTHFFYRTGIFSIKKQDIHHSSMEEFELMSIDFGAKEFLKKKNKIYIYTNFEKIGKMKEKLENLKIKHQFKLERIPKKIIQSIPDHKKKKVINLMNKLEENNDIKNIYSNYYKKVGQPIAFFINKNEESPDTIEQHNG